MEAPVSTPDVEVPGPVSAPARIVGTFFSPTATFQSIARRPGFILPVLLWTAASILITMMMLPKIDFDRMIRSSIEKRGQSVPEDRIQQIVAQQKRMAPVLYTAIGGVTPVIICLLVTLVFWAAFKAFGWDLTFKQGLGVTTHGFLPGVLGGIILIPVMSARESIDPQAMGDLLRSNLGFLVEKDSSPVVHSLLQSVDVFSFWSLFLMTIGYSAAARISRKSAGGVVVGIWAIYVLGKAGLAAILH
jgi:hypothetical protein